MDERKDTSALRGLPGLRYPQVQRMQREGLSPFDQWTTGSPPARTTNSAPGRSVAGAARGALEIILMDCPDLSGDGIDFDA
jgi:hypothetical protein